MTRLITDVLELGSVVRFEDSPAARDWRSNGYWLVRADRIRAGDLRAIDACKPKNSKPLAPKGLLWALRHYTRMGHETPMFPYGQALDMTGTSGMFFFGALNGQPWGVYASAVYSKWLLGFLNPTEIVVDGPPGTRDPLVFYEGNDVVAILMPLFVWPEWYAPCETLP